MVDIKKGLTNLFDTILNFMMAHIVAIGLGIGIFLLIVFIIMLIGCIVPDYSVWSKLANKLDKFATGALIVVGTVGFGELLYVVYMVTQLFKYGGQ